MFDVYGKNIKIIHGCVAFVKKKRSIESYKIDYFPCSYELEVVLPCSFAKQKNSLTQEIYLEW